MKKALLASVGLLAIGFAVMANPPVRADVVGYGPVLNPGSPDAAVMVAGKPVQLEYLHCVPAWLSGDPDVIYWEDGSLSC